MAKKNILIVTGDLLDGFDSLCETLGKTYPHVMTIELTKG